MKNKYSEIKLKDIVPYNEKLNTQENYVKMLNVLEKRCAFIGITFEHEIIEKFKDDIIQIEKTNHWWACIVSYIETITYIKASKELFDYLKKYEGFYKYILTEQEFIVIEETSFGTSDIAFFDNTDNILLGTCTHEGFTNVTRSIHEEFTKC